MTSTAGSRTHDKVLCRLGTKDSIRQQAQAFAPRFQYKSNARTRITEDLMDNSKAPFLLDPFIDNTVRLLEKADKTGLGCIASGHKMGGKTQTLAFLSQFLEGQQATVVKLSLKREGHDPGVPGALKEMFRLFNHDLFRPSVIGACERILTEALSCDDKVHVGSRKDLIEKGAKYDKFNKLSEASWEELAYTILHAYEECLGMGGTANLSSYKENVKFLLNRTLELLYRSGSKEYFPKPCFIIIDEIGELFNTESAFNDSFKDIADCFLRPFVNSLTETANSVESGLYVVLAGSKSVADYVTRNHLKRFIFHIRNFTAYECDELWSMWKLYLKNKDISAESEMWMLDAASGDPAKGEENTDLDLGMKPAADGGQERSAKRSRRKDVSLGEGLLHLTDGVPGYITEFFDRAVGGIVNSEDTLSSLVERCYNELKAYYSKREGIPGACCVQRALQNKKWADFAQFGLCPSHDSAPSGPVIRFLLEFLLKDDDNSIHQYAQMLTGLIALDLSGSFRGAVYQQQVIVALLKGDKIYAKETSFYSSQWTYGQPELLIEKPALLLYYENTSSLSSTPMYFGSQSVLKKEEVLQNPTVWLYVAESETFPSIDLSIAVKSEDETVVTLYHCSVSIDQQHFAPTSTSKKGHLPLQIEAEPPRLLRSNRARDQLRKYRETLLSHQLLKDVTTIHHRYAVVASKATDLCSPTPPFQEAYWVLSL